MSKRILSTTIIAILAFALGWWLNGTFQLSNGGKQKAVYSDSLHKTVSKSGQVATDEISNQYKQPNADTIIDDDFELIVKEADGTINVFRKFQPKKTFNDFVVTEKFSGLPPAHLNFSYCKYGKLYQTATRKAADNGANFAGHYALASMGCGTSCQVSTIVDLKTGNVYAGPEATGGYDYRLDSRLLIVNPPDSSGLYYPCSYCTPEQYLWTGNSFKRL